MDGSYPFPTLTCSHCQEPGLTAEEINDGICLTCEDDTVRCEDCGVRIDFAEAVEMADGYCCEECAGEAEQPFSARTHGTYGTYRGSAW